MNRLENKVAIITGAGSGMGFAAVELFAKEGAKVVGVDIKDRGAWKPEYRGNEAGCYR